MIYELIRSVIFYSGGFGSERGTHLSLISLVSHVMWDWSEREPLWLPATQLFAAAQCHCHSPAVLMCSFLSTSINVTFGRRARKWRAVQSSEIRGKGKRFIYVSGVHGHSRGRTRVIYFFYFLKWACINKNVSAFPPPNVILVPRGPGLQLEDPPVVVLAG